MDKKKTLQSNGHHYKPVQYLQKLNASWRPVVDHLQFDIQELFQTYAVMLWQSAPLSIII